MLNSRTRTWKNQGKIREKSGKMKILKCGHPASSFVQMRNLIVSRLTMFNARRSGEPVRLTLREWKDAKSQVWIDQNLVEEIDNPQERALLDDMKLCYQAGKGSRKLVPVLIPKDTIEPITKLLIERESCGIHPDNPYLFPNSHNSLDHASGYHSLRAVVKNVPNLKSPQLLIADKFRHMVSTFFASLELPEEQRDIFVRHMGHSEAVNRNVYQCPMAVKEVTRVGQFLTSIDNDSGLQSNSQRQPEIEEQQPSIVEDVNDNQSLQVPLPESTRDDLPSIEVRTNSDDPQSVPPSSSSGVKINKGTKQKQRTYTKWSEEDTRLVKEYFDSYIVDTSSRGRLPGKGEVVKFLSDHDILKGHSNKAALVRTKVFNEKKKYREGGNFSRD